MDFDSWQPAEEEEDAEPDASAVSDADLAACLRVLRTLATEEAGISDEYRAPRFKPLRSAMQCYVDEIRTAQYGGQAPDQYQRTQETRRRRGTRSQQEKALDRSALDKTGLRAERLRMLQDLEKSGADEEGAIAGLLEFPRVPDGAVVEASSPLLLTASKEGAPAAESSGAVVTAAVEAEAEAPTELHKPRVCYTCKARFRRLHQFYAQLCAHSIEGS